MSHIIKAPHGTAAWFEMVGALMCEAASQAALGPAFNVSLVERYTDGVALAGGLVQGLRFDVIGGAPSFRVGARRDEPADIAVEITAAASLELNTLYSDDPQFEAALNRFQGSGEMRVTGDLSPLGAWFGAVHDRIVDRTN
jgi:hypothetical protein